MIRVANFLIPSKADSKGGILGEAHAADDEGKFLLDFLGQLTVDGGTARTLIYGHVACYGERWSTRQSVTGREGWALVAGRGPE
jgi:hypothetical protein